MKKRLVVQSDKLVAALDLLLPLVLLAIMITVLVLSTQGAEGTMLVGLVWGILIVTYIVSRSSYVGVYTFIPADEYQGARLVIEQGRRRYEVKGIPASGYQYGQTLLEKWRGVGHVKVKGTIYRIHGIPQGEEVMAWIAANFPEPRQNSKKRRR